MENSAGSSRHYNPNMAVPSTDSSAINNMQLLFANFGLANNTRFQLESHGASTSLHVNPPPKPHQVSEQYRLFDDRIDPRSMWAVDAGNYSNFLLYESPVPFNAFNYMNNTQQNYYVELAITPEGSKQLQNCISDQPDPGVVNEIFSAIIGSIIILMTNEHGRYVVAKLIPFLQQNKLAMIVEQLSKQNGNPIVYASFNNSGSHSLQRLMKPLVRHNLAVPVVAALALEFCHLMKDKCASNVVVKCVELVPAEQAEPIYRACIKHWLELATHQTGCPSLNHFIEHVKGTMRIELLSRITDHTVFLAQDPTGNHVLQRVLHLEDPRMTEKICRKLRGEYGLLAVQKAGSYVVEKCLNSSGWVHALGDLLIDEAQLVRIAKDRYGNYVVKKALQLSKSRSFSNHYPKLVKKLNNNLSQLQSGYAKNVLLEMANLNLNKIQYPLFD